MVQTAETTSNGGGGDSRGGRSNNQLVERVATLLEATAEAVEPLEAAE